MTIRYIEFADGNVLTAEQLLDVQDNGVVQVDTFAELTGLSTISFVQLMPTLVKQELSMSSSCTMNQRYPARQILLRSHEFF